MIVLLIDTNELEPKIVKTNGRLKDWYRLIGCELIDIVSFELEGHIYDAIFDDEGLFAKDFKVTAIDKSGNPVLLGNIVICRCDENGCEISLSNKDINRICRHLVRVVPETGKDIKGWIAISGINPNT